MSETDCTHCDSAQLVVDFNKNSVPAVLGTQTKYTACIFCDELLSSLSSEGCVCFEVDLNRDAANHGCGTRCTRVAVGAGGEVAAGAAAGVAVTATAHEAVSLIVLRTIR